MRMILTTRSDQVRPQRERLERDSSERTVDKLDTCNMVFGKNPCESVGGFVVTSLVRVFWVRDLPEHRELSDRNIVSVLSQKVA